jgi:hypothetical protein
MSRIQTIGDGKARPTILLAVDCKFRRGEWPLAASLASLKQSVGAPMDNIHDPRQRRLSSCHQPRTIRQKSPFTRLIRTPKEGVPCPRRAP